MIVIKGLLAVQGVLKIWKMESWFEICEVFYNDKDSNKARWKQKADGTWRGLLCNYNNLFILEKIFLENADLWKYVMT